MKIRLFLDKIGGWYTEHYRISEEEGIEGENWIWIILPSNIPNDVDSINAFIEKIKSKLKST